jgi:predicted PurR-regulated permease PerM
VRSEAKKAFVWIGVAALLALAVYLAQPLLVMFGGVVFAAMIDGGQRLLAACCRSAGACILIVLLAALAFLIWLVMFAGSQIAAQAAQMPAVIETQTARWAGAMPTASP